MSERFNSREVVPVVLALAGVIGGFAVSVARRAPQTVPIAPPPVVEQARPRGFFDADAYGQPLVLDCDTQDSLVHTVTPDREVQTFVFKVMGDGKLRGAARLQVLPPGSEVGHMDLMTGPQGAISQSEYTDPDGAEREVGDASLTVKAYDEVLTFKATC
jgi:hypothetical protein